VYDHKDSQAAAAIGGRATKVERSKFEYLRLTDENDMDEDDDEIKFTKETTLELLFNWIDESIEKC